MAEVAEEAPEAEAEEPEAERPLERIVEEADVEHSPTDRKEYSRIGNKYSKSIEYKEKSKETNSKPSAKKSGGLERALENAQAVGNEHGIDSNEVFSSILAKRPLAYYISDSEGSDDEIKRKKDSYDTRDGIQYIPITQNPETGEIYFSVEVKTAKYRDPKAIGKFAFHGETAQVGENNHLDVAVRGIVEENPKSYHILLKAWRENGQVYDRVKTYDDGVPSENTIILFKVPWESWEKYATDKNPEAPKIIMSLEEISKTKRNDWAFNNYDILEGIVKRLPSFLATKTQFQISNNFYNPN